MKTKIITLILAITFFSSFALTAAPIQGVFKVIPPGMTPKANSTDKIVVYEIASFGCPHCYKFNGYVPGLEKKYKNKIEFHYVPILWGGENPARLYFLAQIKKGKAIADKVKTDIFSYYNEKGLGEQTYKVSILKYIAKTYGLDANLEKELHSKAVDQKIEETKKIVKHYNIKGTPSFILNGVIMLEGDDLNNFETVVHSWLTK